MTHLHWLANWAASAIYAADCLRRQLPVVDAPWLEILREPANRLARAIASSDLPAERVWSQLLAVGAHAEVSRHLVEVALLKIVGKHHAAPHLDRLADRLHALDRALKAAQPQLLDELRLRTQPLQEQWEARGPGMLKALGRFTDPDLLPPAADVVLVPPLLGGGGRAFAGGNVIVFEAVLAYPFPNLPEVVRLGWLVSQLNLELPRYQGDLNRERAAELGAWGMSAASLDAAQEVELTSCDLPTLQFALQAWRTGAPGDPSSAPIVADKLLRWWQTYREDHPSWPIALRALDMLLETEETETEEETPEETTDEPPKG